MKKYHNTAILWDRHAGKRAGGGIDNRSDAVQDTDMTRKLRVEYAGAIYHVMNPGAPMTVRWIAERLGMGTRGHLPHLLYRRRKSSNGLPLSRTDPFLSLTECIHQCAFVSDKATPIALHYWGGMHSASPEIELLVERAKVVQVISCSELERKKALAHRLGLNI